MKSVFVITRFNGNGYNAKIGKLTASCTAGEEEAVWRVAMKYFEIPDPQRARFEGTGITVTPIKQCHIEDGIGWQPGSWTAERKAP